MVNNIIVYFGGKGTMFKKIINHFPDPSTYNTYIEPFGGSYGIGLKLYPYPEIEIYNDLEQNVYSLFKVISDKFLFEEFKQKCDLVHYSEDLRKDYKLLLKQDNLSLIDRSFYFFYINRTSHNGVGGMKINTIIRRKMSKCISDMLSTIDNLYDLHQRLSKVIVLNRDGIELIKKYKDRENVFIYMDPPYTLDRRTSVRYKVDMTNEQQIELISTIIDSKCKILLSSYKNDLYEKLIGDDKWKRIDFEVKTITGNFKPKTKIESLYKNY